MLSLNLAKIRTAHERFEKTYAPAAVAAEGDSFSIVAPIELAVDIYKDKDHFRLAGSVVTTLELTCSRCLESFTWPVSASFDLRYQPRTSNVGDGEREVEEDDLSTAFYENDEIDLGQLMREQIYLSLPMKPLCLDDCQGLCAQCGTNLNRGICGCQRSWEDPRFAPLAALKQNDRLKSH